MAKTFSKVPVGTIVREYDDETKETGEVIADLTHDGERIIAARGGIGGRGNTHFVTSTRRAPCFCGAWCSRRRMLGASLK